MTEPVISLRDVHVQHRINSEKLFAKDTVYALTGAISTCTPVRP